MTADEENIVKHKVHCGAPDSRLAQFLLGMKSIEHKVHPVISKHVCLHSSILLHTYTETFQEVPFITSKAGLLCVSNLILNVHKYYCYVY